MADRIQIRRDIAANWTSANPVLAEGEIGLEKDTKKFKVGDGTTAWSSLAYWIEGNLWSVAKGGTGVGSITGIVVGNGVNAFTSAVSGTDIKTINGNSILGSGDLEIAVTPVRLSTFDIERAARRGRIFMFQS